MRFAVPRQRAVLGQRAVLSQRAVLGGLLIALAAALAFVASGGGSSAPSTQIVIARNPIAPGKTLSEADLETVSLPLAEAIAAHGFDSIDALIGASTLAPVDRGELVQRSAVRSSTSGAEPGFSFPIDREHAVDGDLRPGDTIDVLATFGSGIDAETAVLARSVQVSDVTESDPSSMNSSGRLVITATFSTTDQVLDIAHAAQVAELTAIRTTGIAPSLGSRTIITGPAINPFDAAVRNATGTLQ